MNRDPSKKRKENAISDNYKASGCHLYGDAIKSRDGGYLITATMTRTMTNNPHADFVKGVEQQIHNFDHGACFLASRKTIQSISARASSYVIRRKWKIEHCSIDR